MRESSRDRDCDGGAFSPRGMLRAHCYPHEKISLMYSQKTVVWLARVLDRLFFQHQYVAPLWTWAEFCDELYASGGTMQLLRHIEQKYGTEPRTFLPFIHDGTIPAWVYRNDGFGQPRPEKQDRIVGARIITSMIRVAVLKAQSIPDHVQDPLPSQLASDLVASLRDDGFDFIAGKVVLAGSKAVELQKEDEYLVAKIRDVKLPNIDEVQHHHQESEKAFANRGWGAAASEARNFLVATLRGLREVATTRGKLAAFKQPGKDGPLIEDFKHIGLFTEDEKNAVMHAWVLLSHSGPHVGIQEEDSARLSRLLAIGITEWVVLKFIQWELNAFKPF